MEACGTNMGQIAGKTVGTYMETWQTSVGISASGNRDGASRGLLWPNYMYIV